MRTYLSQGIRHIWNVVGLFFLLYCKPSWMNLVAIGISITYVSYDMILLLTSQMCCFIYQRRVYVKQKHDVTNTEIEDILRERDVVVEGELETSRCDVDLEEFFNYVVQNENLSTKLERSKKKFCKNRGTLLIGNS